MYFYNNTGMALFGIDFSDAIKTFLNGVFKIWNKLIHESFEILLKLPSDVSGMSSVLKSINTIFVGVGTSLVVLFFLLGFCAETTNVREEMRYDTIVKYLVRLVTAEYFTVHSKEVLMQVLKVCKAFCKALRTYFKVKNAKLHLTEGDLKVIDELGWGTSLVVLIVSIIIGGILIILGSSIVWTCYTRFLKVCLMIPFGSLALATMAGPAGGEVSRVSSAYTKAFLANAISSIVIAVALIFGTAIMNGLPINMPKWGSGNFMAVIGMLVGKTLQASVLVSCVKEAEHIAERMMGAY